MNTIQKIIKNLALALSFFLIVQLCYIPFCLFHFFSSFKEKPNVLTDIILVENTPFTKIDLDLSVTDVILKKGNQFQIKTNNPNIQYRQLENKIDIEEDSFPWKRNKNYVLEIMIPKDHMLKKVNIDTDVGNILCENMIISNISLNTDVGKIKMNHVNILEKANIEVGIGDIQVKNTKINQLDLNIDIGNASFQGKLLHNSEFSVDIGLLTLKLDDSIKNYTLNIEQSLGNLNINGDKMNKKIIPGGHCNIDVDSDIGDIMITTKELKDLK